MRKFLISFLTSMFLLGLSFGQTNVDPGVGTLGAAITAATSGDVLVLQNGGTYTESADSVYVIAKELTIKAQDSEGAHALLTFEVDSNLVASVNFFQLNAGGSLTLDGLEFYGMADVVNAFRAVGDFIEVAEAGAGSVTILNCKFHNANGWLLEGGVGPSMENITIDNSIVSDCKGGPHFKDGDLTGSITITNSTFMNITDRFLRVQSGDAEGFVEYCTVYNVSGKRVIMAKGMEKKWVITNSIFSVFTGSQEEGNIRPGNNAADSLAYSILHSGVDLHGDWEIVSDTSSADPMFTNAANGDLTLMAGSPALTMASDGGAIGDPRWVGSASPAPITIDGERDAFYDGLAAPSDGHIQIPIEAWGNSATPPDNSLDLSTRIWMAWDETYLYFYEERKDDLLSVSNTATWQNDCVELKVDSDPTQPVGGDPVDNIRLTVLDTDLASEPLGVDNLNADGNLKIGEDAWVPTTDDYARVFPLDGEGVNMEFRVPWEVINTNGPINPVVGTTFGFAINIADNDGAARENQLFWSAVISDNIWNTPDLHGTLELLADNKVNFIAQNSRVPENINENADLWYTDPLTGIEIERTAQIANAYELKQNYPNPFNPTTNIEYSLKKAEIVSMAIYDVTGKLVTQIFNNERQPAGTYQVKWDGKNSYGNQVVSGFYFYKLTSSSFEASKKMLLIK